MFYSKKSHLRACPCLSRFISGDLLREGFRGLPYSSLMASIGLILVARRAGI
jgi:hypothetical protein